MPVLSKNNIISNLEKTRDFLQKGGLGKERATPIEIFTPTQSGPSVDEEKGIISIVATTEYPVKRHYLDWSTWEIKSYWEILVCNREAIDSTRMDSGSLKYFLQHRTNSVSEMLGKMIDYQIADGALSMRLQFDMEDEELKDIFGKISRGFLSSHSVGYQIDYSAAEEEERDGEDYLICKRWMPLEVSAVTIPADPYAQVIEMKQAIFDSNGPLKLEAIYKEKKACADKNRELPSKKKIGENMPEESTTETNTPERTEADVNEDKSFDTREEISNEEAREDTPSVNAQAESPGTRVAEVQELGRRFGLSAEEILNYAAGSKSLSEIRGEILEGIIREQRKNPPSAPKVEVAPNAANEERLQKHIRLSVERIFGDKRSKEKTDGLETPLSISSLCRQFLELTGERNIPLENSQVLKRAMGVADFSDLLTVSIERILYDFAMEGRTMPWTVLSTEVSARDFRKTKVANVQFRQPPKELAEGESIDYTGMSTTGEEVNLTRYANGICFTYEALRNDDIGLIQRQTRAFANLFRSYNEWLFWDALVNQNLADGNPLFHGDNVDSTDTALTNAALQGFYTYFSQAKFMDLKKRDKQKGVLYAPLSFDYLLVPVELYMTAQGLIAPINAQRAGDVNVFADMLKGVLLSPYISAGSYYGFAGKQTGIPAMAHVVPAGMDALRFDEMTSFDNDGIKIKGVLETGHYPIDRRAARKQVYTA